MKAPGGFRGALVLRLTEVKDMQGEEPEANADTGEVCGDQSYLLDLGPREALCSSLGHSWG